MATEYVSSANKSLNMTQRKNLKEYEGQIQDEIKKLEPVLGFPLKFEWRSTPEQLAKADSGYDQRPGEVAFWHVSGVVEVLVNQLADDMTKEGFQEAVSKKTFALVPITEEIGYNARWAIREGEFLVEYEISKIGNNCGPEWVGDRNSLDKLI